MKIDLTKLKIYTSIDKSEFKKDENGIDLKDEKGNKIPNFSVINCKKAIADHIYNTSAGIANHALALKIFNAEGIVELNKEEEELFNGVMEGMKICISDAIKEQAKENNP